MLAISRSGGRLNAGYDDTICHFCPQNHAKINASDEKTGTPVVWVFFFTSEDACFDILNKRITFSFPTCAVSFFLACAHAVRAACVSFLP